MWPPICCCICCGFIPGCCANCPAIMWPPICPPICPPIIPAGPPIIPASACVSGSFGLGLGFGALTPIEAPRSPKGSGELGGSTTLPPNCDGTVEKLNPIPGPTCIPPIPAAPPFPNWPNCCVCAVWPNCACAVWLACCAGICPIYVCCALEYDPPGITPTPPGCVCVGAPPIIPPTIPPNPG